MSNYGQRDHIARQDVDIAEAEIDILATMLVDLPPLLPLLSDTSRAAVHPPPKSDSADRAYKFTEIMRPI